MGARSYIVRGLGNDESFHSCSHGAGRAMSRTEARRRFTVADHVAATAGIECRKDEDVIDETPMAYKSIDRVMDAQRDLVEIVTYAAAGRVRERVRGPNDDRARWICRAKAAGRFCARRSRSRW